MANSFEGSWSYRSLQNIVDLNTPFDQLRFGAGTLTLAAGAGGAVTGNIGGPGWNLAITGTATQGDPARLSLEGRGLVEVQPGVTEEWVYAYLGYVVPPWPNGVGQRDTIVGGVIRVIQHGGNPAGVTASFYAVRQ